MSDFNVDAAGLLLDMAALQRSRHAAMAYKRAAHAVFSHDRPVRQDLERGVVREIRGIGPTIERLLHEYASDGRSESLKRALADAPPSARRDVEARRGVRDGFLSWSSVLEVLRAPLPAAIVSPRAYRGDLQMHTNWSDGADRIDTMAEACRARGWSRLCVTDHSYGLPIARGISMEHVRRQHREIDDLNARPGGGFRVLKGIEANVLADGRVDLAPEELALFDLVVAAPHSLLRKPFDQTSRMLAAVGTPGVHILGHPRGRVFAKRAGIVADWARVFAEAARRKIAIELDGTWDRQDLDAGMARVALEAGCIFAIDSDAHAAREVAYVDYAIAHARLAGIPADRVINCWDDRKLSEWSDMLRASVPAGRATAAGARSVPR